MRNLILLVFYILSYISLTAQVPVSKEPRHHVIFENEKVRILNVLLPVGDTTQYHIHSTPSVFIGFTKTSTGSQLVNEQPVTSTSVAGSVWFENLNPPHIKIHRVWNQDTAVYHVMDVELLSKDSGFTQKPLSIQHVSSSIDTPWVRTYKIKLGKSEQFIIKAQQSNYILVPTNPALVRLIENGRERTSYVNPGQFFWIKTNGQFSVINDKEMPANFALLEIK